MSFPAFCYKLGPSSDSSRHASCCTCPSLRRIAPWSFTSAVAVWRREGAVKETSADLPVFPASLRPSCAQINSLWSPGPMRWSMVMSGVLRYWGEQLDLLPPRRSSSTKERRKAVEEVLPCMKSRGGSGAGIPPAEK